MGRGVRDGWIRKIVSEDGPPSPTTRLVLLVLGSHMDRDDGSCFPSVRTLIRETGLSKRSVLNHLALADNDGWIERTESGTGQGWKRHVYQAVFPARLEAERGAAAAPPFGERGASDDTNAVHLTTSTQLYNKPSNSRTKRGARRAPPSRVAYSPEFEAAWAAYPKRAGGNPKKRAFAKYQGALQAERATDAELLRATEHYCAYCNSEKKAGTQYVLQAQTFFTDERWRDFLQPVSANGSQAIGNLQEVAW